MNSVFHPVCEYNWFLDINYKCPNQLRFVSLIIFSHPQAKFFVTAPWSDSFCFQLLKTVEDTALQSLTASFGSCVLNKGISTAQRAQVTVYPEQIQRMKRTRQDTHGAQTAQRVAWCRVFLWQHFQDYILSFLSNLSCSQKLSRAESIEMNVKIAIWDSKTQQ